jgi:hypothetical protein
MPKKRGGKERKEGRRKHHVPNKVETISGKKNLPLFQTPEDSSTCGLKYIHFNLGNNATKNQ